LNDNKTILDVDTRFKLTLQLSQTTSGSGKFFRFCIILCLRIGVTFGLLLLIVWSTPTYYGESQWQQESDGH